MSDRRRLGAAYLLVQAGAVIVWWLGLVFSPTVRDWFELAGDRRDVLNAFVLGDLVVLGAGSVVAGWGLLKGTSWASAAVVWVAGGCAYSTLYLAAWVALGGNGAIGLVPMVSATVATTLVAILR